MSSKTSPGDDVGEKTLDPLRKNIDAGLAKLSAEDRVAAEKQKLCPVSNEPLGAMGKPIKLTIEETKFFVCCGGCKRMAEQKPDELLANLAKLTPKK